MIRKTTFAALVATSLFASALPLADVPAPPVPPPGNGKSPATGGLPPVPPPIQPNPGTPRPATPPGPQPPPMHQPNGLDGHVPHPDPAVTNTPPDGWYLNMHQEIFNVYSTFESVEAWAFTGYMRTGIAAFFRMYVRAAQLRDYADQYFWTAFDASGPKQFPFGRATRGDFNAGFDYFIRPVYIDFVQSSASYFQNYSRINGFDFQSYEEVMRPAMTGYHRLARCNFGKNGTDRDARDDDEIRPNEDSTGIEGSTEIPMPTDIAPPATGW